MERFLSGRARGGTKTWRRLYWLKSQCEKFEVRLVMLTMPPLLVEWLSEKLRAVRSEQVYPDLGVNFKVRRVLRALPYLPGLGEEKNMGLKVGPCVVVLEPSHGCELPNVKD